MNIAIIIRPGAYDCDCDWLAGQAATLLGLGQDIVTRSGGYPETVEARSMLCYRATRELGITTLELSKRLGIFTTHSQSIGKMG